MGLLLVLTFVFVPLAEIALFIEVGDQIGVWPTIGATIATALIGTSIMRLQGRATFERARQSMDRGEMPVDEALDGVLLLLSGALLLTPGFFTDSLGFLLLLPPLRAWLRGQFRSRMDSHPGFRVRGEARRPRNAQGKVIDGEFEDMTDILEDERHG
ncbi:FxsA family protein [Magnetospira thiophila]